MAIVRKIGAAVRGAIAGVKNRGKRKHVEGKPPIRRFSKETRLRLLLVKVIGLSDKTVRFDSIVDPVEVRQRVESALAEVPEEKKRGILLELEQILSE